MTPARQFAPALALLWVLAAASPVSAHEPVFSLGPHTIFAGGWSVSAGTLVAPSSDETAVSTSAAVTYGLTEDLSFALGLPYVIHRPSAAGDVHGVGDPVAQVKFRPLKNFGVGNVDALSVIGAVKAPLGQDGVSSENFGFVGGVTAGRENLRYYLFGTVRYGVQTAGANGRPPDLLQYDIVPGVRPVILEYNQPDVVLLVELNGQTSFFGNNAPAESSVMQGLGAKEYRTVRQAHSGGTAAFSTSGARGTVLAVTPEILASWGPAMLKVGVQFPVFDTYETTETPPWRLSSSLIVQF